MTVSGVRGARPPIPRFKSGPDRAIRTPTERHPITPYRLGSASRVPIFIPDDIIFPKIAARLNLDQHNG
jgi:hypothetical protein